MLIGSATLAALTMMAVACVCSVADDDSSSGGGGDGPTNCTPVTGCEAQDAAGEGSCEAIIGTKWDGANCVDMSGCGCAGCDCDDIYPSLQACEVEHAACLGLTTCGGPDDTQCTATEYCDFPGSDGGGFITGCGMAPDVGICRPRPTDCTNEPSTPNCGCDGNFYPTYCDTNAAGVDISTGSDGTCP